jgi:hypothetical protein
MVMFPVRPRLVGADVDLTNEPTSDRTIQKLPKCRAMRPVEVPLAWCPEARPITPNVMRRIARYLPPDLADDGYMPRITIRELNFDIESVECALFVANGERTAKEVTVLRT